MPLTLYIPRRKAAPPSKGDFASALRVLLPIKADADLTSTVPGIFRTLHGDYLVAPGFALHAALGYFLLPFQGNGNVQFSVPGPTVPFIGGSAEALSASAALKAAACDPAIFNAADLEIRSALRALLPIQAEADLACAVSRVFLALHVSDQRRKLLGRST